MHFFVPDVPGDVFLSYFSCHSSQTLCVLNIVTQVPSRPVTCAECRHTAAPFVCPTIPSIKSNVGRNDNHHIVAFCTFRWPLFVFLYFGSYFRLVVFLRSKPDPAKTMAAVTNAAATVSSTSLVGLFLLSEYAWPTRVTPLPISCQKFVWSSLCYQKHSIILRSTRYELYILSAV